MYNKLMSYVNDMKYFIKSVRNEYRANDNFGYHKAKINKGILGEISKIQEELDELKDAKEQGIKLLELCELADIIGAIAAYLDKHHNGINIKHLQAMAVVTKRAFKNGHRK